MDRLSDAKVREGVKSSGATVFHGECEWYPGQLEEELIIGAWQVGLKTFDPDIAESQLVVEWL